MKKQEGHPSLKGIKKHLNKLLTLFIIVVLLFTGVGIFYAKDFGIGYKYYELSQQQSTLIGVTQQENFITTTIDEYLSELEEQGYYIVSSELNLETMNKHTVVKKTEINEEGIKNKVLENLDVQIFATKLTIENDDRIYYFKTETECNSFVNELNKYIKQEYKIESSIEDSKIITSKNILEEKKADIIKQKEEADAKAKAAAAAAAQKKNYQVTSRSGSTIRKSNYKGGAPMASYTYISSYYGPRNGGQHTGVDFAAPAGTHIYAWKDGTVTFVGWSGGYGKFIIVDHGDGTVSRYAHCSGYAVSKGQSVVKGQTIGYVGTTGNSTGNHLHFEIKINGSFVNPLNYL